MARSTRSSARPDATPGGVDLRELSARAISLDLGDRPLVLLEPARPAGLLSAGESPLAREPRGVPDRWRATWDRIRTWGLTRSSVVTHRWVPGSAGIAGRLPEAVVDAIADVHARVGIERGPGLAIARLQKRYDEARRTRFLLAVEDRSGLMVRMRSALDAELPQLQGPSADTPVVRVLGADRRRLGITWLGHDARCEPEARLAVSARPLRVTIDLSRARACAGPPRLKRTAVLLLRAPLPDAEPTVAIHRGLVSWIGSGPRRVTVDIPGPDDPTTVDQVEVEDLAGEIVSARAAPGTSPKVVWIGDPDGVQTGEKGDELYVRWATLKKKKSGWPGVPYTSGPPATAHRPDRLLTLRRGSFSERRFLDPLLEEHHVPPLVELAADLVEAPTSRNPKRSWSVMDAGLGVVTPASTRWMHSSAIALNSAP